MASCAKCEVKPCKYPFNSPEFCRVCFLDKIKQDLIMQKENAERWLKLLKDKPSNFYYNGLLNVKILEFQEGDEREERDNGEPLEPLLEIKDKPPVRVKQPVKAKVRKVKNKTYNSVKVVKATPS